MTEPGPTVAVVFPELLGTYGDGGNVTVLRQRLLWRGVAPEFVTVGLADPVPSGCDLYLLGGGEDDAQAHALAALRRSPGLTVAVEGGATVLAVCAGLQMLGSSITGRDGTVQDGLGLPLELRPVELGKQAARLVVERLDDPLTPPRQIEIPTRLIRRGSGEIAHPASV